MRKSNNLGLNIDHVATIRQARKTYEPDPLEAAYTVLQNGADSVTIHLREDRRHINDDDLKIIRKKVHQVLNLEMSVVPEIVKIACSVKPDQATVVPEKRQEVTTEGGLDVKGKFKTVKDVVKKLRAKKIRTSLFIGPDPEQIKASADTGAECIEIHTGEWANKETPKELDRIIKGMELAKNLGLVVNAGHGLNYHNVIPLAETRAFYEFNIGHAIIARAVFSGLADAVRDMRALLDGV